METNNNNQMKINKKKTKQSADSHNLKPNKKINVKKKKKK